MDASPRPRKILIVDDERNITDTFVTIFTQTRYDARGAYSAEQALELIQTWAPDLAVIDICLPKMNGIQFALLLKAQLPRCRLTIFSGHTGGLELLEPALRDQHPFEVLQKPVHPTKLLDWAGHDPAPPIPEAN